MIQRAQNNRRQTIFISKATPGDDEFVLWLAPRLEAAGYAVFADVLNLEPGDRWRKQITGTLQETAVKMLLCCRDSTLEKNGVQEEIGIAEDLAKELADPRFIIPLRLEKFRKVFGIGELQYVDFVGSWARGLRDLLDTLETQDVPRASGQAVINPNWENYKKRLATKIEVSQETLTTNWLRVATVPEVIRYYQPTGALDHSVMQRVCKESLYPAEIYLRGFFSFATPEEVEREFISAGKFTVHSEHGLLDLISAGCKSPDIEPSEARNLLASMLRKSWETMCRSKGLFEYSFSSQPGFHVTKGHIPLGKRVSWGKSDQRRSSVLRNAANGKVWQYGISATPCYWPFLHFRFKARVLFSGLVSNEAGEVFDDVDQQHRLRRSICKAWRNKAWHGRLMAFLRLLSGTNSHIDLALSPSQSLKLDATPVPVACPITVQSADTMSEDAEEQDTSTLGNFDVEDDE